MEKAKMLDIVKKLPFDTKTTIFTDDEGSKIYLWRPSELSKRFKKKYDVKKNFQVFLKQGERKFRPNHLRVFIDLNLRTRSRPDLKKKLLLLFDEIYYGGDPEKLVFSLQKENFKHSLNSLQITTVLVQLFVIEQEFNYLGESNYDPPTLFFQGWVRQFLDNPKEIDNLCMSVCHRQPPAVKYTSQEDKNHKKKFNPNRKPLWYLED